MKVEIEISKAQWKILKRIARALDMTPTQLAQQCIDVELANMDVWLQRAEMMEQ